MKYIISIIILSMSIACSNKPIEEKAILNVMKEQEKAWNDGDIDTFMQGYWQSDSLMFIGKNGIKYGWATTLNNYKKSYPNKDAMGKLEFKVIQLEINKSNAYMLGKWSLVRKEDNPNGYFTLYWKKIKDQWFITIDHTS